MTLTELRSGRLRSVFDTLQGTFPRSYRGARRALSHLEWHWARVSDRNHYDASFWDCRSGEDWQGFAQTVLDHFDPSSVLDVGCGDGRTLAAIKQCAPAVRVFGIDHSPVAVERARRSGVAAECRDLTAVGNSLPGRYQLGICLETAEHFPAKYAGRLLTLLESCDTIVFSAATPGQGGVLHVNEQPLVYWIEQFRRHGYTLSDRTVHFRHAVSRLELPWYYAANLMIFERAISASVRPQRVAVGIVTRDRPDALLRCVASLSRVNHAIEEIIIVDDGSATPVEEPLRARLPADFSIPLRVLRGGSGLSAGRNLVLAETNATRVLFLDDDAFVVDPDFLRPALDVLDSDAQVAVVALAQGDADGRAWPVSAQPAPADAPVYVRTFIGYGHVVRTAALRAVGGFRQKIQCTGEERELSIRLLDAGYRVVFLPQSQIAHVADARGRNLSEYLRQVIRHGCMSDLYVAPLLLLPLLLATRGYRYLRMRRSLGTDVPGGAFALAGELLRALPGIWSERRPVSWRTVRLYQSLKSLPAYAPRAERV